MWPLLQEGESLRVQFYEKPKLVDKKSAGKIFLFNDGKEWVAHRAILYNDQLVLKGDRSSRFENSNARLCWGEVKAVQIKSGRIVSLEQKTRLSSCITVISTWHFSSSKIIRKTSKALTIILASMARYF